MKLLFRSAITYILLMLLVLCGFLYMNRRFSFAQRDLILYNDMLHRIEAEIYAGEEESSIEEKYNCNIILSTEINDAELAEMYRLSAFVLDLSLQGEYVGKVAWTDEVDRYYEAKDGFFKASLSLWIAILVFGLFALVYFYLFLIRPVEGLEYFSREIAKGNLEQPLPIHKNNVFGSFVEAFDMMREELIVAQKREIESEKARKELVTELSHDIKTPVSVIKAACEVLEVKVKDKDILEKVSAISQKADTISGLVGNMMHANLEELDQLEVSPREESSLLLLDYFSNLRQYGKIVLENDIPGCLVYMDRLRMEQAIDNVIGNAYKYAGTDIHVHFDLCLVDVAEDGVQAEFLRMQIRDSGPGVSDEELPLLTEKYFRGSNAKAASGSGLGLYLVKYYMGKQGGGMEYYSENGFTVELLLKKV